MIRNRNRQPAPSARRGVVLVEFAVALPMILILVLGAIEATELIYLQQTLELSSYEAARVGARKRLDGPDGLHSHMVSNADVRQRAQAILDGRSVVDAEVSISVADVNSTRSGSPVTVTVSAPTRGNVIRLLGFSTGRTLTASTTMRKDYRQLPQLDS